MRPSITDGVGARESAMLTNDLRVHAAGPLARLNGALQLALGAVFVFAAWEKLKPVAGMAANASPQKFYFSIDAFNKKLGLGMPEWLVTAAAFAFPWTELLCGLCLLLGVWVRAAALGIGAMLSLFTVLVAIALHRGIDVKCGCFGDKALFCSGPPSWCHVYEDLAMLAVAAFLILTTPALPLRPQRFR